MQRQQHIYVNAESEVQARKLDDLLWTFSQGSFIPHRVENEAGQSSSAEPVLIGFDHEPGGDHWHVMINLADEVPEFFSRYERVVEIIDANPERRAQGRERYRFYQDRGYTLNTHNI